MDDRDQLHVIAREEWEEDVRSHRQAAQSAHDVADQFSVKIIDLLYTMAAASARCEVK